MKRVKNLSLILGLVAAFAVAFLFQNCGKGFQSASPVMLSSSAQCVTKLRSGEIPLDLDRARLRCDDIRSYVCERRIFRPGVVNETRVEQECNSDGSQCVEVTVRQYDSSVARGAGVDESSFAEGGEYNRDDVKCDYIYLYKGLSPFEGAGANIEESLDGAMAACNRARAEGS